MGNFDWQLTAVLICVAAAMWSMVARFRNLMAGKGGCGDCSKANPSGADSSEPKLISEDQIEMLYETKKQVEGARPGSGKSQSSDRCRMSNAK